MAITIESNPRDRLRNTWSGLTLPDALSGTTCLTVGANQALGELLPPGQGLTGLRWVGGPSDASAAGGLELSLSPNQLLIFPPSALAEPRLVEVSRQIGRASCRERVLAAV